MSLQRNIATGYDFFNGLLASVAADSAYDKEAVYEAIEAHSPGRRTRVVIPPQRNATLNQNSNTAMQERAPYSCHRKTRPT